MITRADDAVFRHYHRAGQCINAERRYDGPEWGFHFLTLASAYFLQWLWIREMGRRSENPFV
jgi:hypothetical protein